MTHTAHRPLANSNLLALTCSIGSVMPSLRLTHLRDLGGDEGGVDEVAPLFLDRLTLHWNKDSLEQHL